jgi:hypothetical protein
MKLKPAIKVKGKVFTGSNHGIAIKKAQKEGLDVKMKDREKIGKFQEKSGKLLTRKQTKKKYGITHSHEIKLV